MGSLMVLDRTIHDLLSAISGYCIEKIQRIALASRLTLFIILPEELVFEISEDCTSLVCGLQVIEALSYITGVLNILGLFTQNTTQNQPHKLRACRVKP